MSSLKLGKLFGIRISLHYTWFIIIILLAWSLAVDFFPIEHPGLTVASYWILGFIAAVLLFVSVLLHELSHSIVAKYQGMEVRGITLFFFGGVANASDEGLTPKKEFLVAIAGPLFSIALGGVFFMLSLLPWADYALPVIDYLFKINIILAIFNMIPGFPLDGGRVLRSILWKFTDLKKSTRIAAGIGKAFGGVLVLWGFLSIFNNGPGLWYILLGGFLYILASASHQHVILKEGLGKLKLDYFVRKDFAKADPEESLEMFVDSILSNGERIFVVKKNNELFVLDFDRLNSIPRHEWPIRLVKDLMVKVKPIKASDNAFRALVKLQEQEATMLPVVKKDIVIGVVTLESLIARM
ncbi:M50 family metallopeptidase [Nanoarchaeota archaeon]